MQAFYSAGSSRRTPFANGVSDLTPFGPAGQMLRIFAWEHYSAFKYALQASISFSMASRPGAPAVSLLFTQVSREMAS